jgi:hypothetical protein
MAYLKTAYGKISEQGTAKPVSKPWAKLGINNT